MAILIDEIIPVQGFEVVTQQIGAILLLELDNQNNIQSTDYGLDVYLERIEPIDKSEDIVVNVSLDNMQNVQHNEFSLEGQNTFNIDVYCFGEESSTETASTNVRVKLQRVVGWIRYILSSPKYKTLDFAPGLIGGTYVQSITFDDNFGKEDSSMTRMARLQFMVRVYEQQNEDLTAEFTGNDTVIKLGLTEKGYKLIFNK